MNISIALFLLPILIAVYGLFLENGVFVANLIVVPLIFMSLIKKGGLNNYIFLSFPFVFGFFYWFIDFNGIKTFYFVFEGLSLCLMIVYPAWFLLNVGERQLRWCKRSSVFFVVLYFLMLLFDSYWVDGRYAGPLLNTNLSVYFLALSLLFIVVARPLNPTGWGVGALLSLGLIVIAYLVSQSRSIVFFVPVFFYLLYRSGFSRLVIFISGLVISVFFIFSPKLDESVLGRMDYEEVSFLTRANITDALVDQAIEAGGIPRGPRYATEFVVNFTNNPEMHSHNDMLAGLIDYGFLFLIAICVFVWRLYKFNQGGVFVTFSVFAYFSCALHGYFYGCLLLPYLLAVLRQYGLKSK